MKDERVNRESEDPRKKGQFVDVSSYTKDNGTIVDNYRRSAPRKNELIRDERNIKRDSNDLMKDTRRDNFEKAQFDLYAIQNESSRVQPGLRGAQAAKEKRIAAQNAQGEANVQKKNTKNQKKKVKAAKTQLRQFNKEQRAKTKTEKVSRKLEERMKSAGGK